MLDADKPKTCRRERRIGIRVQAQALSFVSLLRCFSVVGRMLDDRAVQKLFLIGGFLDTPEPQPSLRRRRLDGSEQVIDRLVRVRCHPDPVPTGEHFDDGMRGRIRLASPWWALNQQITAIQSL